MPVLQVPELPEAIRSTAHLAAAALLALAREEAAGRRPRRLIEPDLATWRRFRGRMGAAALLELVLEDAAVTQSSAFDAAGLLGADARLAELPDGLVADWLALLPRLDLGAPPRDYVDAQARLLGITPKMARADLHRFKRHHKILELPGTGGLLAHHAVTTQADIHLQDAFTIAVSTWQERLLAGLIAVENGLRGPAPIVGTDAELRAVRDRAVPFDYVIGARSVAPDKALLEQWFPTPTTLVLV